MQTIIGCGTQQLAKDAVVRAHGILSGPLDSGRYEAAYRIPANAATPVAAKSVNTPSTPSVM